MLLPRPEMKMADLVLAIGDSEGKVLPRTGTEAPLARRTRKGTEFRRVAAIRVGPSRRRLNHEKPEKHKKHELHNTAIGWNDGTNLEMSAKALENVLAHP
ncbi:MAG: hypothetical protein WDN06_10330 [Asticcacaulis sp.]